MRNIEVKNDRLLKCLNKKAELVKRINEITDEGEKLTARGKELEEEVNKLIAQISRQDELARPEIKREMENVVLAEFEDLSKCYLAEEGEDKGKAFLQIADRLEEFKVYYKQKKDEELAKANNDSDTNKNDGDSTDSTGNPPEVVAKSGD